MTTNPRKFPPESILSRALEYGMRLILSDGELVVESPPELEQVTREKALAVISGTRSEIIAYLRRLNEQYQCEIEEEARLHPEICCVCLSQGKETPALPEDHEGFMYCAVHSHEAPNLMSEFPSLTGATAHLILLTGRAQDPICLLQLQENERMAFYKFLGGYVDIAKQERIEDTLRREIDEEAPGLADLLDLSDARLYVSSWFTIMNYRKERKETCTFIIMWMSDTERASVEEYIHNQNGATLLEASHGETSLLVLKPLLETLEETFSSAVSRRRLVFPYGLLERLPSLDPKKLTAIHHLMAEREAEKKKSEEGYFCAKCREGERA